MGGADTFTVNDLSGTDVTNVHIDLFALGDGGDAQIDNIIVNGTNGDDHIRVAQGNIAGDASTTVLGLPAQVHIVNGEAANDRPTINARNGNDTVDASGLTADAILLTEDGGNGDDHLIGGEGGDITHRRQRSRHPERRRGRRLAPRRQRRRPQNRRSGADFLDGGRGDDALLQGIERDGNRTASRLHA